MSTEYDDNGRPYEGYEEPDSVVVSREHPDFGTQTLEVTRKAYERIYRGEGFLSKEDAAEADLRPIRTRTIRNDGEAASDTGQDDEQDSDDERRPGEYTDGERQGNYTALVSRDDATAPETPQLSTEAALNGEPQEQPDAGVATTEQTVTPDSATDASGNEVAPARNSRRRASTNG